MDWKDYFKITIFRETLQGPHRYFQAELRVKQDFTMEELLMREFEHLSLTDQERKNFSLTLRKVYLRHSYFRTPEFERIVENFCERLSHEKDQLLTFSTHGAGVYLFIGLIKNHPRVLRDKKLICYTSDLPLEVMRANYQSSTDVHIIHRPYAKGLFKDFPTLYRVRGA